MGYPVSNKMAGIGHKFTEVGWETSLSKDKEKWTKNKTDTDWVLLVLLLSSAGAYIKQSEL